MTLLTAVVQIGNSDDKLSQAEWSQYVADVDKLVQHEAVQVHFSGASPANAAWQNWCWVLEADSSALAGLRTWLPHYAREYRQDSIALTVGETVLVTAQ